MLARKIKVVTVAFLEARGWSSGPKIFRFGRSWADGSSGCIGFVKFFSDLRRFE